MSQRAKELCLEDYVRFFNKEDPPLTLNNLSKIAQMNGFIKMKHTNKARLLDVLRAVDLTPPGRSTVGECLVRSSSKVDLTLDEVLKDVISIGWQECPIVSILSVGNEAAEESGPISSACNSAKGGESKGFGAKRKWKTDEMGEIRV